MILILSVLFISHENELTINYGVYLLEMVLSCFRELANLASTYFPCSNDIQISRNIAFWETLKSVEADMNQGMGNRNTFYYTYVGCRISYIIIKRSISNHDMATLFLISYRILILMELFKLRSEGLYMFG